MQLEKDRLEQEKIRLHQIKMAQMDQEIDRRRKEGMARKAAVCITIHTGVAINRSVVCKQRMYLNVCLQSPLRSTRGFFAPRYFVLPHHIWCVLRLFILFDVLPLSFLQLEAEAKAAKAAQEEAAAKAVQEAQEEAAARQAEEAAKQPAAAATQSQPSSFNPFDDVRTSSYSFYDSPLCLRTPCARRAVFRHQSAKHWHAISFHNFSNILRIFMGETTCDPKLPHNNGKCGLKGE